MSDDLIPGELLSYKRKLAKLRDLELGDFLSDLLKRDRLIPDLFPDIASAVANSSYVPPKILAEIITRTKSSYLQSQWDSRIADDPFALIDVMRALPSELLERDLCQILSSATGDRRLMYFRPISEVLAERGGRHSQETIESLLFDLEPEGKTAISIAQAVRSQIEENETGMKTEHAGALIKGVELSLLIESLKTARDALRSRNALMQNVGLATGAGDDEARKALKRGGQRLNDANEEFAIGRLEEAAKECRRAAEAFGKVVWWVKSNNNAMDDKTLEDIRQALKTKKLLPEGIDKGITMVQLYSSYGAHDKIDEGHPLTIDIAKGCLSATEAVADWAAKIVEERDNEGR
jgi:hypothetical protein